MQFKMISFDFSKRTDKEVEVAVAELERIAKEEPEILQKLGLIANERRAIRKKLLQNIVVKETELKDGEIWIITLLKRAGWVKTNSEGLRLIDQGAVEIRKLSITESEDILVFDGDLLRCGKKKAVIVLEA